MHLGIFYNVHKLRAKKLHSTPGQHCLTMLNTITSSVNATAPLTKT